MRSFLLLALCVPFAAHARSPVDRFQGEVKEVELSGTVEVPLVSGLYGDELPYVWVKVGEDEDAEPRLFLLDLGGTGMVLDPGAASDLGVKVKTHRKKVIASLFMKDEDDVKWKLGGKQKTAELDELHIGDLTLEHVTFKVKPVDQAPLLLSGDTYSAVAGVIGGGALGAHGLGVAVLPSKGVVRFAPAEQAGSLLSELGNSFDFPALDSEVVKHPLLGKQIHGAAAGLLTVTAEGQQLPVELHTARLGSHLTEAFEPPQGLPSFKSADYPVYWVHYQLGSLDLGSAWTVRSNLSMVPRPEDAGWLGYTLLHGFDLAVDYSQHKVALAPASDFQQDWPGDELLSAKTKDLEDLAKGGDEDEGKKGKDGDEDEDAQKDQKAGILADRALLYLANDQPQEALADARQVTELQPDDCSNWELLSKVAWRAGDFQTAYDAATKAMKLYESWASLDEKERERIQKLDEDELENEPVKPQDLDSCFDASGLAALAALSLEKPEQAISLYDEHFDLHPAPALAAGVAYLAQGDPAKAQGPLRQAIEKAVVQSSTDYRVAARIGLADAYLEAGDADSARTIWEEEAPYLVGSCPTLHLYYDIVEAQAGPEEAMKALVALSENFPNAPAIPTFLGALQSHQGKDGSANLQAGYELLQDQLRYRPRVAENWALLAVNRLHAGDTAAAREAVDKAVALGPSNPYVYLALSGVLAAEGKYDEAREARAKARLFGSANAAFLRVPDVEEPEQPVEGDEGAGDETDGAND